MEMTTTIRCGAKKWPKKSEASSDPGLGFEALGFRFFAGLGCRSAKELDPMVAHVLALRQGICFFQAGARLLWSASAR